MSETKPAADSETSLTPDEPIIAIVCALHLEIEPFLRRCEHFKSESGNGFHYRGCKLDEQLICVVEGGSGQQRARQATQAVIDAFSPTWVLSVGFSGALTDDLTIGNVVVANGIRDASGQTRLDLDLKMESDPKSGLHVGLLGCTDHIVREVIEKRDLAARTGAIAVDMESLAVAQVCRERKTRFMAIRVISDDLHSDLPPEVLAILGPKGTIRAGALFGSLLKRPSCAKDLWNLREQASNAAAHLGRFLPGVIEQLSRAKTARP